MRRVLSILALAVALAGCSTLDLKRPVAKEDLSRIKKIGVASFLGDTFYGISIGTTVFSNSDFSAPVPDWKVDEDAVSRGVTILLSSGRFEVAPLDHGSYTAQQLRDDKGKRLWELAASQGFDTLVILWPDVSENFRLFKPGYGLFERSFLGLSQRCLYAAYRVEVEDVARHTDMAWEWGGEEGVPCLAGSEQRIDYKSKFEAYSDAEKQAMRQGVEARISETLGAALRSLKLVAPLR